jgi:hypothetical protein
MVHERTVKLPCQIGDWVWIVRNYSGMIKPTNGRVKAMFFTNDMKLRIAVRNIGQGEWGKDIFETQEEAMEAARRRT